MGPGKRAAVPQWNVFWRFLEVNSRRILALTALAAAITVVACDDNGTTPPPPPTPAQISTVASWTRGQGLPHNDVWDILVTSEGQLWIGTQAGIAIYPTITATAPVEIVNELNGLPNPKVRKMAEYNGVVYVATWGGGIAMFDMTADTWTHRNTTNGLRANNVADVVASPTENRIYYGTTNGVSIYDIATDKFSSFIPPNLLDPVCSAIDVREVNSVVERWYGPRFESVIPLADKNKHGITVSKGASTIYKYTLANSGLTDARVNDIFFDMDPDAVGWVATTVSGLARVDAAASTWKYYTTASGLPANQVYSVTRAAGTLWVGTQGGLARMRSDGNWQGYDTGGGLQANRVRRVYSEDGEHLWLGFVEGGAARVNPASAQ